MPDSSTQPPQPQPVPKSRKGRATRAAMIVAAREVFVRDGYIAARITDICERAGVATGTFYTYFTDKDAAFAAVLETAEQEMLHQPRFDEDPHGDGPIVMIEAANRAYLEAYESNVGIMTLLYQVSTINEYYRTILRQRGEAFFRRNARFIARLQAEGLADPELDPYQTSRALSSMVSRVAQGTYVLGEETSVDVMVETLTRLWVNALQIPHDAHASGAASPSSARPKAMRSRRRVAS